MVLFVAGHAGAGVATVLEAGVVTVANALAPPVGDAVTRVVEPWVAMAFCVELAADTLAKVTGVSLDAVEGCSVLLASVVLIAVSAGAFVVEVAVVLLSWPSGQVLPGLHGSTEQHPRKPFAQA